MILQLSAALLVYDKLHVADFLLKEISQSAL